MKTRNLMAATFGFASADRFLTFAASACFLMIGGPPVGANGAVNEQAPSLLLVVGAAGEEQYATNFTRQVDVWQETMSRAGMSNAVIGLSTNLPTQDRELLRNTLKAVPTSELHPLWLILIGHGTFDGTIARFNLRGPDLSASDLAEWLAPFERPVVVINAAPASAPFLNALSGPNRVVVTATRSGNEISFTHFGAQLAHAFQNEEADLDQDNQVSLLEAFLTASAAVREFYDTEGRLLTEHALIDDNGDGKGTPADWFRGIRAVETATDDSAVDGIRAHQFHLIMSPEEQALPMQVRAQRDSIEQSIAALRDRKDDLPQADYYDQLEELLLRLARLYRANEPSDSAPSFE